MGQENSSHSFLPFRGIGNVLFGTSRIDCRRIINSEFETFNRNEFSKSTTDYFLALDIFLEFDENDICQAIEVASPNFLALDGRNLFDFDFKELVDYYSPLSKKYEIEEGQGVTFYDLGFAASGTADGDGIVSVLVFSDKYWYSN